MVSTISSRITHDLPEEGFSAWIVRLHRSLSQGDYVRLVGEVEQTLTALRVQLRAVLGEPVSQRERLLSLRQTMCVNVGRQSAPLFVVMVVQSAPLLVAVVHQRVLLFVAVVHQLVPLLVAVVHQPVPLLVAVVHQPVLLLLAVVLQPVTLLKCAATGIITLLLSGPGRHRPWD